MDTAHEDDLAEYYVTGSAERVGTYFVNTRPPRSVHDLAATSFHEANPGHHLQTTLEVEAPGRHALRQHAAELQGAAYVEGWGLYSERLADGRYADDFERRHARPAGVAYRPSGCRHRHPCLRVDPCSHRDPAGQRLRRVARRQRDRPVLGDPGAGLQAWDSWSSTAGSSGSPEAVV